MRYRSESVVKDLRDLLSDSPLAKRKAFIRSFVEEIKVRGDNVSLAYMPPPMPDGESNSKDGVLPIVRYSGRYRT
jgi:hypothetical protein